MFTRGLLRRHLIVVYMILAVLGAIILMPGRARAWEPTTIRVKVTALQGGPIHEVDFSTTYIHRVLVGELGGACVWNCNTDWPAEAVRAMAVAIRSLGWYYINHPLSSDYDVTDRNPQFYREDQDSLIRPLFTLTMSHSMNLLAF